jgi:hypothetical protein
MTPPNKGMKQTKPAQAMELRSLSPVLDRPNGGQRGQRPVGLASENRSQQPWASLERHLIDRQLARRRRLLTARRPAPGQQD